MSRKLIRNVMVGAVALLLGIGIAYAVKQLRPPAKTVPTTRVQKGTLQLDTNTVAELHTPHSTNLVAPSVSGTLQIIHLLKTGTEVKASEVVVEFDPSEQEFNLEQSRSQLAEADQEITKAKADAQVKLAEDKVALLKAKFDVRRAELEVDRNELVSEIDAKKNLLNLEEAKRRLAQLEQDLNSRAASNTAAVALLEEKRQTALLGMQQAQHNIDMMQLKSPINGLVSIKDNMDASGGMMFPGMQLPEYREGDLVYPGRFLVEVMDVGQMEAVAKVFENDRSNLSVGQTAEIRMDAQPDAVFPAKVKTIAGMASRRDFGADTVRRFDVTFDLLSHAAEMRPGTSAQVLVKGMQIKDQLSVPSQCVFDKDGRLVVYVKHGDHFEATDAKIRFRTENRVVLGNLPEGTEVALVNPEKALKVQKNPSSSPIGVGQ
ncbi:MAG TPA: efflux RND transporter periplasmic adaptor subunit [Candidatus Dormibacteraeota bacterium]|nr:efflux RND transporter periplasmic adaptor subunit [Candidatus Dormibacteraeota bacterium]